MFPDALLSVTLAPAMPFVLVALTDILPFTPISAIATT
jgi:hypothetical protein